MTHKIPGKVKTSEDENDPRFPVITGFNNEEEGKYFHLFDCLSMDIPRPS